MAPDPLTGNIKTAMSGVLGIPCTSWAHRFIDFASWRGMAMKADAEAHPNYELS
jgi:hypothetical protein